MKTQTIISLLLFPVVWVVAPYYHDWMNHPDEAAWVQLFAAPSGLIGVVLCLIHLKTRNKYLMVAVYLVLVVHLLIGLGLHPR